MSDEFWLLVIWLSLETAFNLAFLVVDVYLRLRRKV